MTACKQKLTKAHKQLLIALNIKNIKEGARRDEDGRKEERIGWRSQTSKYRRWFWFCETTTHFKSIVVAILCTGGDRLLLCHCNRPICVSPWLDVSWLRYMPIQITHLFLKPTPAIISVRAHIQIYTWWYKWSEYKRVQSKNQAYVSLQSDSHTK